MSFLENLFLNYLPLAAIVAGVIWYFRKGKKAAVAPAPPAKPAQTQKPEVLKLPPNRARLVALAGDLSGGDPGFVALAQEMMDTGQVPEDTNPDFEIELNEAKGRGPDQFGPVLVQALTSQTAFNLMLDDKGGVAATKRTGLPTVYFDWKEDMPECCMYFDALFTRLTGKPGPVTAWVDGLPDTVKYATYAPIVTSAFAREVFNKAGFTLLEILPPLGWDAHLFAAVPHRTGRRWKNIALRAGKASTRHAEIITQDAYFTSAFFVEERRPEGVTYFEGRDEGRDIGVYWYWEEKAA